jgi:hypothetical protein
MIERGLRNQNGTRAITNERKSKYVRSLEAGPKEIDADACADRIVSTVTHCGCIFGPQIRPHGHVSRFASARWARVFPFFYPAQRKWLTLSNRNPTKSFYPWHLQTRIKSMIT